MIKHTHIIGGENIFENAHNFLQATVEIITGARLSKDGRVSASERAEGANLFRHSRLKRNTEDKGVRPERVQVLLHRRDAGLLTSSTESKEAYR